MQDEFACELEGIRVITGVMVHLCSHQIKKSSAENPNNLSDVKGSHTRIRVIPVKTEKHHIVHSAFMYMC